MGTMRCVLLTTTTILAANNVFAFVASPGWSRSSTMSVQYDHVLTSTITYQSSRPSNLVCRMKGARNESDSVKDQSLKTGGPFSSLKRSFRNAASRLREGPFSRSAKEGDAVDDLLNSDAFLNKKVDMLEKQIQTVQGQISDVEAEGQKNWEEWGPKIERLEQEFSMLKSRGGEIRAKASDKAKAETINDVLAVADNFERAAAAINPETDGERSVADYYQGLYETMMDCLKELGLEEVEQVGTPFDYNIHNAIMRENTNEFEEDMVCKVYQKGYRVGDTLVRPAMVAVAAPA